MVTGSFADAFKRDAATRLPDLGYPIREVSERPGGSLHALCA